MGLDVRVGELVLSSANDSEMLQQMLEKRKAAVLERTRQRNEERKARLESQLKEEKQMVLERMSKNMEIKLPASLMPDDHEATEPKSIELAEEHEILGNLSHEERVTTIVLNASMNKSELTAQLAKRREVLIAKTRARNEHRKRMRIKAKRMEQSERLDEEARRASMNVHRLYDLVKASEDKVKANQNKVKELEQKAEQHRNELDNSLATKQNQKHLKLQRR